MGNLEQDLAEVLNKYRRENGSNTPDFILARYLVGCLQAWNEGIQARNKWYGVDDRPGGRVIDLPDRSCDNER